MEIKVNVIDKEPHGTTGNSFDALLIIETIQPKFCS